MARWSVRRVSIITYLADSVRLEVAVGCERVNVVLMMSLCEHVMTKF